MRMVSCWSIIVSMGIDLGVFGVQRPFSFFSVGGAQRVQCSAVQCMAWHLVVVRCDRWLRARVCDWQLCAGRIDPAAQQRRPLRCRLVARLVSSRRSLLPRAVRPLPCTMALAALASRVTRSGTSVLMRVAWLGLAWLDLAPLPFRHRHPLRPAASRQPPAARAPLPPRRSSLLVRTRARATEVRFVRTAMRWDGIKGQLCGEPHPHV